MVADPAINLCVFSEKRQNLYAGKELRERVDAMVGQPILDD
jgi:hypothetical protein